MYLYWLNFKNWNQSYGKTFIQERFYFKGYIWTPLVKVRQRYKKLLECWK